jgi:hypothetical protein
MKENAEIVAGLIQKRTGVFKEVIMFSNVINCIAFDEICNAFEDFAEIKYKERLKEKLKEFKANNSYISEDYRECIKDLEEYLIN